MNDMGLVGCDSTYGYPPDVSPALASKNVPNRDRTARLAILGNWLIGLASAATVAAGVGLAAIPARSSAAVLVSALLAGFATLPLVLAWRDRDVLDWTRSYPSRLFATEVDTLGDLADGAGSLDDDLESVVELDEATQAILRAGQRYDLGLAFAMAPGLLLLFFATLAFTPLQPWLQLLQIVLLFGIFPACGIGALAQATRRSGRGAFGRRVVRGLSGIWLGLVVLAFAWAYNGAADTGTGTVLATHYALDHPSTTPPARGVLERLKLAYLRVPATIYLVPVTGFPGGLPVYHPSPSWTAGHSVGDPARLVVGPGAVGVRLIREVTGPHR